MSSGDDQEVWENYQNDASEALQDIEESLLALESDESSTENLHRLYRGLHSIKGNSGFLALETIERLAHASEDLIGLVRDGGIPLDRDIVELTLRSIDELRRLIETARQSRRNPPATTQVNDLVEAISRAHSARGGVKHIAKGPAFGFFTSLPVAAITLVDPEPIEIFLAVVRIALPELGTALRNLGVAEDAAGQALAACSKLRLPAERLSLVRVVDACAALEREVNGRSPAQKLELAEMDLYERVVEVEDYLRLIAPASENFGVRGLLQAACAETVFIDLASFKRMLEDPNGLSHEGVRRVLRRLSLACTHFDFKNGSARVLDVADWLLRALELGAPISTQLTELCQTLVQDLGSEAQRAVDGGGEDIREIPIGPDVRARSVSLPVSSALKQVLNERAFAVLSDLRPKGWQTCEVRCSLSAGAEIDARVRDFLRSDSVMLVTSAVDGPDAVFLVGVAVVNDLRVQLAKIDPTRILVRIAGDQPFELPPPLAAVRANSVRVEVKYSEPPKPKLANVAMPAVQAKAAARSASDEEAKDQKAEFLRVDARKISLLLDLASEIGLACGAVTHHPALEGLELEGYSQAAHKLELLVREMQNEVSGMRLVAVAGVFQRMRRVVRDTAMRTGKEVELVLEGEETEIDKVMVDALQDPLVHVLRNAIDHGIELPEERVALGKSRVGRIVLSASHQGGEVSIEVSDDGAGIKRDRVRERAESRGLIQPGAELSDDETLSLVFAPGFSTKETVDELSGRGVGMDVVKTTITGLRGRVGLKSTEGRGSRLTMTMPLTLAFVESMVVRERDRLFALPIEKVFEVFKAEASQISRNSADGQTLVKVRGTMVPVLWLHRFWTDTTGIPTDDVDGRILVVVQTSHGEFALPVDALLGNQQVMLKPLRGPLAGIRAAAGCGMLRTGDVALAIDCEQLYA